MTDPRWVDQWLQAMRSFPDTAGANPWTIMLDHFAKSHPASYQQPFADVLEKMAEQSRAIFDLGQALASAGPGDWRDSVFSYLDDMTDRLSDPETASRVPGGVSVLDHWRQFAGHGAAGEGDPSTMFAQLEKLLATPGLGPNRGHQESIQALSRAWLSYQRAYGDYAAYCVESARRTVERLRDRLEHEFDAGNGPASIRSLYDTWVACSEEVYAERVATQDYMALQGRMVNALMAYRRQARELMDRWAAAANMPTRTEVDSLHLKLKAARDELRALKARLDEDDPDAA
jgi:polyhydroxyalkanoate synthase subunit PhaE